MAVRAIIENGELFVNTEITNIESEFTNNTISEIDLLYYENYRMIFYFKYYMIQTYDEETWYDLLDQKKFRKLFYCSVNTYGESIFGALVEITVQYMNINTGHILSDFAKYVRSVQDLHADDFARFEL
ncbi:MAG: hypothetical protein GPJ54_04025 [Candidatus Heimdallarchaeota archaeon]|nr:hypothetical protein [Candidatus Heimdallarchaeota archaeon]